MKINVGSGAQALAGYHNIDRKSGGEAFPLSAEDASADEIRASHVLEHFPRAKTFDVIANWVSKLKPGGVLKIAVPDFEWIARNYLDGKEFNISGYTMGGQVDGDDFHHEIFDEESLGLAMRDAGLVDVAKWEPDADDCSALEVSLNMRGVKPVMIESGSFKVAAIMSVPRLGFMDNFYCALESLAPLGIKLRIHSGAYWGQGLERGIEQAIAEDKPDAILTIDYDTVFTRYNVTTLMRLMVLNKAADAICALQQARGFGAPLLTLDLPPGVAHDKIPVGFFGGDLTKIKTGHFGLTMIRTASLMQIAKPWIWSRPAPDNTWGDGRTDDDIYFWREWEIAGKTLFNANRVVVGHLELMIRWPGRDFSVIHQRSPDFFKEGPPEEIWR